MSKDVNFDSIQCIAYDFDGVMTDNRVLVTENGQEAVFVNRSDGYAVAKLKEMGYRQVIISTEKNPVVAARAKKLQIDVIHGVEDKGDILLAFCQDEGIRLSDLLFIGNDTNDMPAFELAGMTGAPNDAEKEIYARADWKSTRDGGYGVVRELYECIIRSKKMVIQ